MRERKLRRDTKRERRKDKRKTKKDGRERNDLRMKRREEG